MHGGIQLVEILDEAIAADGASFGNIQFYNPGAGGLQIVAQRGFPPSFLSLFETVRPDEPSACARAFRQTRRVMIPDVRRDLLYAPYQSIAAQAGFRAVQSTPVFAGDRVVAVLSTHFEHPHTLTHAAERILDHCAHRISRIADGVFALLAAATTPWPAAPRH